MIKFDSIIFISLAALLAWSNNLSACTIFCLKSNNQIVLCKNFDWDFDYGMIEVNKRGLFKKAFITDNETPVEWTSKYGSITFNHVGKEFPLGGMNEAGLVIEEANYFWTKYPAPDNRPTLNELQWIQFQLDNFSTVQEVIKSDFVLRITGHLFNIHYLVCDRKGNTAVIEFLEGKLVCHTDGALETAVLTNHSYDQSIEALKDYKGFGGIKNIPQEYESLNNFVRTSSLIRNYSSNKLLIDYSFNILSAVSTDDTQWSIVYDISNSRICFKTNKNPQRRWINLKHFNFSCDSSPLSLNINTEAVGNIENKFIPYTSEDNEQLVSKIHTAFKKNGSFEKEYDTTFFAKIARYPKGIQPITIEANDTDSLTLSTLSKMGGSLFYTMNYYSHYNFKDYLEGRIEFPRLDSTDKSSEIRCTCFTSMGNSDSMLFGRNFDYPNSIPLLLFTYPKDGYASMSMTDLSFFGYDYKNLPDSFSNRKQLLKTPWLPVDGVNEKGVAIGILTVEKNEPPNDPNKRTINEAAVIRLVLDYADNVEEAIELIQRYNVNTTLIDPEPEHYLIADLSGKSVIVEFLEYGTKIIRNQNSWQVATNLNIYGKNLSKIDDERYLAVSAELKTKLGNVSMNDAMSILRDISEINTQWSAVYNMTTKNVAIIVGRNYEKIYELSLKELKNGGSN